MTRLASILGVATVATLILLSGCESPTKTDYAKDLEGTWTNGPAEAAIMNPTGNMPPEIPVMRTVTAEITPDGANKGSFSVTVSDMVNHPLNEGPFAVPLVSKASGTFEVDGTKITMTIPADGIVLPLGQSLPDQLTQLTASPQVLLYDLADSNTKLDLSGAVLLGLQVTTSLDQKFTLTKQMASAS